MRRMVPSLFSGSLSIHQAHILFDGILVATILTPFVVVVVWMVYDLFRSLRGDDAGRKAGVGDITVE